MRNDVIQILEAERKTVYPMMAFCILIFVVGFLCYFVNPFITIGCMLLAVIFYLTCVSPKIKQYKADYKRLVVEEPLKQAFQNLIYQSKNGFSKAQISGTGLIMMGNIFQSEDYISGSYHDVHFERSDVLIQDQSSDGNGNTTTTTIFKGRWLIFDFNKNFHTQLQLAQRGFAYEKKKTGFFTKHSEKRHKVQFENERFNENFSCYCQDDQEAYYLITPQLMEAIMNYTELADGRIMLGFINNKLHLAVSNNKDSFEPSIMKSLSYQNDILAIKQEISAITDFVNVLKLDRDLYKQTL